MPQLNDAIARYVREVHALQVQVDHGTRTLSRTKLSEARALLNSKKQFLAHLRKTQAARAASHKKPLHTRR